VDRVWRPDHRATLEPPLLHDFNTGRGIPLHTDKRVTRAVVYEPRVPGRSGATHKVEFVFYQPLEAVSAAEGEIVAFASLPKMTVTVDKAPSSNHKAFGRLGISYGDKSVSQRIDVNMVHRLPDEGGHQFGITLSHVKPGFAEVCLLDMDGPVASIESKRVGAQRFAGSEKLGSGIQTIEKAKQTALVAIDFDLNFNDSMLCSAPTAPRKYKSIAALGNGVHWTEHDLKILGAYVDHTYLVRDEAIIRYADYVRSLALKAGEEFFAYFMAYFQGMTKTPPDSFIVTNDDFPPMRPLGSAPMLDVVAAQIQPFLIR